MNGQASAEEVEGGYHQLGRGEYHEARYAVFVFIGIFHAAAVVVPVHEVADEKLFGGGFVLVGDDVDYRADLRAALV